MKYFNNFRKYVETRKLIEESVGQTKKWLKQKKMDPEKSRNFLLWMKSTFQERTSNEFKERYGEDFLNKFIFWVAKNYLDEGDGVQPYDLSIKKMFDDHSGISRFADLVTVLEKYADNVERGLIPKDQGDIYKLKSFADIKKLNTAAEEVITKSKEKEMAKAGAEVVIDGDNFFLVRPTTEEASCLFGRNTRWCISATKSRNYFNQYVGEGKAFYFLRNENLPNDHIYKKIAFVVDNDSMESMEPYEIYDAEDNSIDMDEVVSAIQENIFGERYEEIINEKTKPTKEDISKFTELGMKGLEDVTEVNLVDEIMEQGLDIAGEYLNEINGEMYGHLSENPASASMEERTKEIQERAERELKHLSVYSEHDNYGDGDFIHFSGFINFDFQDLDWEWDNIEDKIEKIVSDEFGYGSADEVEVEGDAEDGYEVRISLQNDYDEPATAEGFEGFVNRMIEIDGDYEDYRERMTEEFEQQGLVKSDAADFLGDIKEKIEANTKYLETDISKGAVEASYILKIDYKSMRDDVIQQRKNAKKWKVGGSVHSAQHTFSNTIRTSMAQASNPFRNAVHNIMKDKVKQLVDTKQLTLPGMEEDPKKDIKDIEHLISNTLWAGQVKFREFKAILEAPITLKVPYKFRGDKSSDVFGSGYKEIIIEMAKAMDDLYPVFLQELKKLTRPYFEEAIERTDNVEKNRRRREKAEELGVAPSEVPSDVVFENKRKIKIRILKS